LPNTLTHIAVQGFAAKGIRKEIDPKLIYLGLLIPDLPYILRRIILVVYPTVNEYELALYAIIQSSLIFSLLLCLAFSLLTSEFRKTFAILSINALFHLFLDATQFKWGSGIHLFAPFYWKPLNFGFYWPDSILIKVSVLLGLAYFIMHWKKAVLTALPLKTAFCPVHIFAAILIVVYLLLPPFMSSLPENVDSHFIRTLRYKEERAGKYVEIDRAPYKRTETGGLIYLEHEVLKAGKNAPSQSGQISLKGSFIDLETVDLREWHLHSTWFRDSASYVALLLVSAAWAVGLFVQFSDRRGRAFK